MPDDLYIFVVMVMLIGYVTSETNETSECEDLSADELGDMYRKWVADDRHLLASFPLHSALARRLFVREQNYGRTIRRALMAGQRICPKSVNSKSKYIMESSTCPWYLELTFDVDRYPMYLATARCRCKHCVGMGKYVMDTGETRCKEVTVKEKVIRRKIPKSCDENHKAVYIESWEDVVVGCTCTIRGSDKEETTKVPP